MAESATFFFVRHSGENQHIASHRIMAGMRLSFVTILQRFTKGHRNDSIRETSTERFFVCDYLL